MVISFPQILTAKGVERFYEKNYKRLLILSFIVTAMFILIFLVNGFTTGDFIKRDVSLKGGFLVTIDTDKTLDIVQVEQNLEKSLSVTVNIRQLSSGVGVVQGYFFEIEQSDYSENQIIEAVEQAANLEIENYSFQNIKPAIAGDFWNSTIRAIVIAFLFMSIVVFVYFRNLVVSGAIILAVFSDILETIVILNLLDVKLSIAGIGALLMLIGYSVDTNILQTTLLLKRKESEFYENLSRAIKTGITMQLTAIIAVIAVYFLSPSEVFRGIALTLFIGIALDQFNTWIQNSSILVWNSKKRR